MLLFNSPPAARMYRGTAARGLIGAEPEVPGPQHPKAAAVKAHDDNGGPKLETAARATGPSIVCSRPAARIERMAAEAATRRCTGIMLRDAQRRCPNTEYCADGIQCHSYGWRRGVGTHATLACPRRCAMISARVVGSCARARRRGRSAVPLPSARPLGARSDGADESSSNCCCGAAPVPPAEASS